MTIADSHGRIFLLINQMHLLPSRIFKQWYIHNSHLRFILQIDRGGEYISKDFEEYCRLLGTHQQLIAAYTQQNSVDERKNCTLIESARTTFLVARFPIDLWQECVKSTNYVLNRCTTRALVLKTPFEALYERKPDLRHLKVLGCKCFVHIPKHLRKQIGAKAFQAILVGYDPNSKAYRCYDIVWHRIIINRDVVFLEDSLGDFANANHHDIFGDILHQIAVREGEQPPIRPTTIVVVVEPPIRPAVAIQLDEPVHADGHPQENAQVRDQGILPSENAYPALADHNHVVVVDQPLPRQ